MSPLEAWITIAGLTLVTLVTRAGYLFIPERFGLPDWLQRGLRYAPACALVAIIVPDIGLASGPDHSLVVSPRLWGVTAGAVVYLGTKSMLWTIALGMLVFTVVRYFG
ncbi:MAG: AzlD domain-containing protein [Burkholderiaceae bacterium]|jgi:branched-subunit amino acid transport protein